VCLDSYLAPHLGTIPDAAAPYLTKYRPPPGCVREHSFGRGRYDRSEGKLNPQTLGMPAHYECRDDGLIPTGRRAEERDDRDLPLHRIQEPRVIRRVRVGAYECVVDDIIACVDLAMSLARIIVPDSRRFAWGTRFGWTAAPPFAPA
jgi:hypothetical protein